ncbi:MAG: hypothetical protein U0136_12455 [Bdellovibrionota bacterium]
MFPKYIPLSGADMLMLAFDRIQRRAAHRGNVCALALRFEDLSAARDCAQRVQNQAAYHYLHSLRLRSGVLRSWWSPARKKRSRSGIEELALLKPGDLTTFIAHADCRPRRDPPFRMVLIQSAGHEGTLLFFWHHALLDARGAEYLISSLLAAAPVDPEKLWRPQKRSWSFSDALKMKRHIFEAAAFPISNLTTPGKPLRKFRYHRIHFSVEETKLIDSRCRNLGAEVFKSSVYLSAAARGATAVLAERGRAAHPLHLVVPHNLRRRKKDAFLSNQVSFLFYRIAAKRLSSMELGIGHLIDASTAVIAANLHHACVGMLNLAAWLPSSQVEKLLRRPSRGELATFYFSDTGELDLGLASGLLRDAVHYPPHFAPPGFTTVFTRFAGRLTVMIVAAESTLSESELKLLERSLRIDLTPKECSLDRASTN